MSKTVRQLEPGDTVYAATPLYNDGSIPELEAQALIAEQGCRGVIINVGHLEEQPDNILYLARFETENLELGPAIGCWPDEIVPADQV